MSPGAQPEGSPTPLLVLVAQLHSFARQTQCRAPTSGKSVLASGLGPPSSPGPQTTTQLPFPPRTTPSSL